MNNNKIPRIVHHIAPKDKDRWHPIWDACYPSWEKQFPEFEHKLWSDEEDIDNLVKQHFPDQWEMYSSFPTHIMKIDFARFCILYEYGGIYADMDVFCYKNFYDELSEDFHIVEAPYGEKWMNGELQVENCLMCSTENNEFVHKLIQQCKPNYLSKVQRKFDANRFGDLVTSRLIGITAGPAYVSEKMIQHDISKNSILPGKVFNNHGLSYDAEYRTKHMLTGIWGKEAIKEKNEMMRQTLLEYNKYASVDDAFDPFYDYTDENYIQTS